jgi:SAM-dependent methyltransferase
VTGLDLSPSFVDAATYLTERCGLSDRVAFQVGDAVHPPFEDGAFDAVFLQHVAMNVADRAALYAAVRRLLAPAGRFATYDLVLRDGDVVYPVPWARDASTSFLLTADETRSALAGAGFEALLWRDDSQTVVDWFSATLAGPSRSGPNLGLVLGPEFLTMTSNLARNIREHRLGVLSAVLTRGQ